MRPARYHADKIRALLRKQKVATMAQLKKCLGTDVDMTVYRKLKQLGYRTSYSHGGAYYTLDEVARFDKRGFWSYGDVHFSTHGTLLATIKALVEEAEAGLTRREIEDIVHVGTKEALAQLCRQRKLVREECSTGALYCSVRTRRRRRQLQVRRLRDGVPKAAGGAQVSELVSDEIKAAIVLFVSLLDEKQRRLYAGLESMRLGSGGDQQIASLLGLGVRTVIRGRQELAQRDVEIERVRRAGGGRKPVKKKRRRSSRPSKRS